MNKMDRRLERLEQDPLSKCLDIEQDLAGPGKDYHNKHFHAWAQAARRLEVENASFREKERGILKEINEIEQILGKALGAPELYPVVSKVNDGSVCIGEYTAGTIARRAANEIAALQTRVKELETENAGLRAHQVPNLDGGSKNETRDPNAPCTEWLEGKPRGDCCGDGMSKVYEIGYHSYEESHRDLWEYDGELNEVELKDHVFEAALEGYRNIPKQDAYKISQMADVVTSEEFRAAMARRGFRCIVPSGGVSVFGWHSLYGHGYWEQDHDDFDKRLFDAIKAEMRK